MTAPVLTRRHSKLGRVIFDARFPNGAVTRYAVRPHCWGSLCRAAKYNTKRVDDKGKHLSGHKATMGATWASFRARWLAEGHAEAVRVSGGASQRGETAKRHAQSLVDNPGGENLMADLLASLNLSTEEDSNAHP